jgi:hypothetical protein
MFRGPVPARGSARLIRIHIRSLCEPIELGTDQKLKDWKRIRTDLIAQSERLTRLARTLSDGAGAEIRPTANPQRELLPSILNLVAAAPKSERHSVIPNLEFPMEFERAAFPFGSEAITVWMQEGAGGAPGTGSG